MSLGDRLAGSFRTPGTDGVARGLTWCGLALISTSMYVELTNGSPVREMVAGLGSVLAFLLAVPLARGSRAQVLRTRGRALAGASGAGVLAVSDLWQSTDASGRQVLPLLLPSVLMSAAAVLSLHRGAASGRAARRRDLAIRLEAEEAERRRWARELHDGAMQELAAIDVRLSSLARRSAQREELLGGIDEARTMVREQIRTLRHLIVQMRPLALDTLGLRAALEDLARRVEDQSDVRVHCELSALPEDLSPDRQAATYRIVQEALSNAVRHAACGHIVVSAGLRGDLLSVSVRDDGRGLPSERAGATASGGGYGRLSMAERAESIGARLSWSTPPSGGTVVMLRWRVDAGGERRAGARHSLMPPAPAPPAGPGSPASVPPARPAHPS